MKKKTKKGHRLYAMTVIILGIVIIILSIIVFFYVQKIEIEGNKYTKDIEIVEVLQDDPATVNSLYIMGKHLLKKYDMPGSLESVEISLTAPWALKVTVKEKPIVGFVYDAEGYVYFDKEGLVVYKGREIVAEVPQLEGLDVEKATLYKPLNCSDKKLLKSALELLEEVKNYELAPERIVCENGELYLYFGEVCVALGNTITTEKIAQVKPIVEKLEGESGTLHLEFYENESSTVTFNQGEFPGQKEEDEEVSEETTEENTDETDYEEESTDVDYDVVDSEEEY